MTAPMCGGGQTGALGKSGSCLTSTVRARCLPDAILGLDPGVNGGLALLTIGGGLVAVSAVSALKTEAALVRQLLSYRDIFPQGGVVAYLEKVGYIRGDGGKGSFTFGKMYGFLRGVLGALAVPVRDVYPAVWQGRMGCLSRGNKNVTKRMAESKFPMYRTFSQGNGRGATPKAITHAIADALLIAEYGRRIERLKAGLDK